MFEENRVSKRTNFASFRPHKLLSLLIVVASCLSGAAEARSSRVLSKE